MEESTSASATPACASGTTPCRAFSYDDWSNMYVSATRVMSPASFTPTSSTNFNTENRLLIQNSAYDLAGNQTAIGGFAFSYDHEGRVKTSTLNSIQTNYTYDGNGRRVTKSTGGSTTTFVYDASGNLAAEYGGAVTEAGARYLTADHLGSTRLVTKQDQSIDRRIDYLPFGEFMPATVGGRTTALKYEASEALDALTNRFTGKERDSETGLDYFGARYFSGAQGRFTSPDTPLLSRLDSPQMWNLYAYTANNPLKRIDPDGQNWFDVNGQWTWYDGADVDENGKAFKRGSEGCRHSDYTHLIVFQQTGTNKYGAATGTLTLYGSGYGDRIAESSAFSGGAPGKGPVPEGTFTIRLGIRDLADASDIRQTPFGPAIKQFYGIQQIPENVGGYDVRWEWGSIRAALNEARGETRPDFLGNYLHGKTRPGDYTHGCIAERSEQILKLLLQMNPKTTPAVPVNVRRK